MIKIEDTKQCYRELWQRLCHSYDYLYHEDKRFCVRNIMRMWLATPEDYPTAVEGGEPMSKDDLMVEVCMLSELGGYAVLPDPRENPSPSRELLKGIVCVWLHRGPRCISLNLLDEAYHEVTGKRINISRKKRVNLTPFLVLMAMLLCGCHTPTRVMEVERVKHDTAYVTKLQFDSVYVERLVTQERKADTVYVDRLRTEFRYKYLADTCYISRTDSIPVVTTVEVIKEVKRKRSWLDVFCMAYALASLPGLLILLLCLIKGLRN